MTARDGWVTKAPRRDRSSTRLSAASKRNASRIGDTLTPKRSAKSSSERRDPGGKRPCRDLLLQNLKDTRREIAVIERHGISLTRFASWRYGDSLDAARRSFPDPVLFTRYFLHVPALA